MHTLLPRLSRALLGIACLVVCRGPAAQCGEADFSSVYGKMLAAVQGLKDFRATVSEESNVSHRQIRKVTQVDYAGPGLYRIDTRWAKSVTGIQRQVITSDGLQAVVVRHYPTETTCCRFRLDRLPSGRRPHRGVPKKMRPPMIDGRDLAGFELVGTSKAGATTVARFENRSMHAASIASLAGRSDRFREHAVSKMVVWVGLNGPLPRRIATYNHAGRLLSLKVYANLVLNPDRAEGSFACEIPDGAKCVEVAGQ